MTTVKTLEEKPSGIPCDAKLFCYYDPRPKDKEVMVNCSIRFEQKAIDEAMKIHNNFSEFVRDALDEKIKKEQAILIKIGLTEE